MNRWQTKRVFEEELSKIGQELLTSFLKPMEDNMSLGTDLVLSTRVADRPKKTSDRAGRWAHLVIGLLLQSQSLPIISDPGLSRASYSHVEVWSWLFVLFGVDSLHLWHFLKSKYIEKNKRKCVYSESKPSSPKTGANKLYISLTESGPNSTNSMSCAFFTHTLPPSFIRLVWRIKEPSGTVNEEMHHFICRTT